MSKKRYDTVNLFKWLCAWLVVYIHLEPVIPGFPAVNKIMSEGVCRIAVPFFFATSAFFLFSKMDDGKINGKENVKRIWKFCRRILLLYTVWSAVYFGYDIIDRYYNGVELLPLSTYIRKYFLNSSRIHLWYLIASVYAIPIVYLLWRFGRGALIAVCAVGCVMQCLDLPYHWSALYDIPQVIRFKEDFFVVYRTIFLAIPLMSLGVLCAKDYQKHTARQWLIRLILSCGVYVVEMIAVYIIKGQKMEAEILLSGPLVVYYLVNWQFTLDFSFPSKWVGEALRLSSTWIYCAHMLFLSLYRCIFAYQGIIRYVVVGGLTVVSGIIAKILVEKRKEQKRLGLRS